MARVAAGMGRFRYKPHNGFGPTKDNPHKGMAAFLLSDEVQGWADDGARRVAVIAAFFTPRSKGPGPHMADQFEVREIAPVVLSKERNARRAAEVFNDDRGAAPVEFGLKGRVGKHMLTRAGMLVGEYHPGRRKE